MEHKKKDIESLLFASMKMRPLMHSNKQQSALAAQINSFMIKSNNNREKMVVMKIFCWLGDNNNNA